MNMTVRFDNHQTPLVQANTPPTHYHAYKEPVASTSMVATFHATSTGPTTLTTSTTSPETGGKHTWAYILVPLGAIVFLGIVIFVIVVILKKNRLDKLRHHLMPLYSFDPAAVDEDQDWECELLDGDKEQHVALRSEGVLSRSEGGTYMIGLMIPSQTMEWIIASSNPSGSIVQLYTNTVGKGSCGDAWVTDADCGLGLSCSSSVGGYYTTFTNTLGKKVEEDRSKK